MQLSSPAPAYGHIYDLEEQKKRKYVEKFRADFMTDMGL